jgi:hypothetical protein
MSEQNRILRNTSLTGPLAMTFHASQPTENELVAEGGERRNVALPDTAKQEAARSGYTCRTMKGCFGSSAMSRAYHSSPTRRFSSTCREPGCADPIKLRRCGNRMTSATHTGVALHGKPRSHQVRVCDAGPFLVLKLRAFARRMENKDVPFTQRTTCPRSLSHATKLRLS